MTSLRVERMSRSTRCAALAQLALDARAGLLDLALDAVALGAPTPLVALDVGLQALAAGDQLLLGLLARGHAVTQALDGGHDAVAGDEEGADRDEDGALGVLLSAIDRRLGELGARGGGLPGGRGALARGGGLVAAASSSGLLGGGGALGRVGGALGGGGAGLLGHDQPPSKLRKLVLILFARTYHANTCL